MKFLLMVVRIIGILLIVIYFISRNRKKIRNKKAPVSKSDLIKIIDSMESDARHAQVIINRSVIAYECTGKRSYALIFNTVLLTLGQLKRNIDVRSANHVYYMLDKYYNILLEPLLNMTIDKITFESDEMLKTADSELKDRISFQCEVIADSILGIIFTYTDFRRKHIVDDSCECSDMIIEACYNGYQDVIKEGKL